MHYDSRLAEKPNSKDSNLGNCISTVIKTLYVHRQKNFLMGLFGRALSHTDSKHAAELPMQLPTTHTRAHALFLNSVVLKQ